ncbi:hypothetical protein RUM44_011111 [Polyplax serrata]|uniref:DUF4485 domain-containing protein n=1 Tax=Polyplax serrata TaxID=468196 RepID=A0ABR1AP34_POLSC
MDDELKKLNYDCNYNIYLITEMKDRNFSSQSDRNKIILWLKKLNQCPPKSEYSDIVLRNEFLYCLLTCVKNGELRPPFNEVPPTEPIGKLRHLLVLKVYAGDLRRPSTSNDGKSGINTDWVDDLQKADSNIPDIYRKSPDGGEFLSQQPIPKSGAFCYLAIVSKSTSGND